MTSRWSFQLGIGCLSALTGRLGGDLVQSTILLNPTEVMPAEGEGAIADYFWIIESP